FLHVLTFLTGLGRKFKKTKIICRGTREKSRLEARSLRVPCASGLRPRPRSSDPRQDRRPARRCMSEVSLLFTTGKPKPPHLRRGSHHLAHSRSGNIRSR